MRDKFLAIENELNQKYLERRDVIRGLLAALLSKQHILLLGPPGTAKSELTEDLCRRIGGNYFRWLLSKTSTPEELFGPISLKALESDSYRRITANKLPEANIAFLDEIFKCNSAVLNSMLSVLNERLFFNDGLPTTVPLEMVVGASNELPEDREELGALWDRFLLRYVVGYIRDPRNFEKLLKASSPSSVTTLSAEELALAQEEAENVKLDKIIHQLLQLRQLIKELNISVSDRRWKQSLSIIKAYAWLEGRTMAGDADMEILSHSLWTTPEQIVQTRQTIMSLANPLDHEAQDLLDTAMELWQAALNASDDASTRMGTETNAKLRKISKRLGELQAEAINTGKSDLRITEALNQVLDWNKEVVNKCLGINI